MLTLAEAWATLAEEWAGAFPVNDYDGCWRNRNCCVGLCMSIHRLYRCQLIKIDVLHAMLGAIDVLPCWQHTNFKWPWTREGAEARYQFCCEQADKARGPSAHFAVEMCFRVPLAVDPIMLLHWPHPFFPNFVSTQVEEADIDKELGLQYVRVVYTRCYPPLPAFVSITGHVKIK